VATDNAALALVIQGFADFGGRPAGLTAGTTGSCPPPCQLRKLIARAASYLYDGSCGRSSARGHDVRIGNLV
jgi:hypothetical protein